MNGYKYRKEQQQAEDVIIGTSSKDKKMQQKALRKQVKKSLADAQERLRLGMATPEDLEYLQKNPKNVETVNPANISLAERLRNQVTMKNLTTWFPFPKPPEGDN